MADHDASRSHNSVRSTPVRPVLVENDPVSVALADAITAIATRLHDAPPSDVGRLTSEMAALAQLVRELEARRQG
jgi:hypothetical protein